MTERVWFPGHLTSLSRLFDPLGPHSIDDLDLARIIGEVSPLPYRDVCICSDRTIAIDLNDGSSFVCDRIYSRWRCADFGLDHFREAQKRHD